MRALHRKVLRDLWHLRGQALAIALVIASGVATYVMSLSTLDSLRLTRQSYYDTYRFADAFASLERAPESLRSRIEAIPGVRRAQTRVVAGVNLTVPGYTLPASGLLISLPDRGEPPLNGLYLRKGRWVDARRDDEVLVNEAFAQAHDMQPGARFGAIINGRLKELRVVGIALSPEYIFQFQPGALIPDFESYGVMWMARTPLAAAFDMDGAFNDVALALERDANAKDVILRLDNLLDAYGGLGAYARPDQVSHRYLNEEFRQLETMATMFPVIFLGVAAFLLNVVVSRLVSTQREQIAALKAFGYSNLQIGVHYLEIVLLIVALGAAFGVGLGAWFGRGMSRMYMEFYKFPYLDYDLRAAIAVSGALISAAAAVAGTLYAVRAAALLPPAEAMRPAPPARYRESWIERLGMKRFLAQTTRMVLRNIGRRPVKSGLSVTGIAMACSILIVAFFFRDASDELVRLQFGWTQRDDLTVTFFEPTSYRGVYELHSLEGVSRVEPFRAVSSRLRAGHRTYRTAIQGIQPDGDLYRLLDTKLAVVPLPEEGVVLTDYLAQLLGVRVGDTLTIEVLEGSRPVLEVTVAGLVKQYLGLGAYMSRTALNRLLGEGDAISGAYLGLDSAYAERVYRTLEETPRVAGTAVRENVLRNLNDTMAQQLLTFAFVTTLFAGTIAFGVVYNTARISLSERGRELASLRVLGMTRGEISYILLGELAVLTLLAVPVGFVLGRVWCAAMIANIETDLFRLPLIVQPRTYAFAALVVLVSAVICSGIVRRRLDRLDLVAVLKTRE